MPSTTFTAKITEVLTEILGRAPTADEIIAGETDSLVLNRVKDALDTAHNELTIEPGDDIPAAIANLVADGGGILHLSVGTYDVATDILIPSNVYLIGAVRDLVIIDFGGGNFSVQSIGTDVYDTGTVDTTDGSTTVTGTGTTWDVSMEGEYIFLNDSYYIVATVNSTTDITLDFPYSGANLTGASYAIANVVNNALIENITVQNSINSGIKFKYNIQSTITNVNVYDCDIGIEAERCVAETFELLTLDSNGRNCKLTDVYSWTIDNAFVNNATVAENLLLTRSGNATFFNNGVDNATTVGIRMIDCPSITFVSVATTRSGTHGFEFVSGTNGISISGCLIDGNSGDGVKFTASSDRNVLSANAITNNGAYGVNIADATCDDTIIGMNNFDGNGTSAANDSGTGTVIRSNTGLADN